MEMKRQIYIFRFMAIIEQPRPIILMRHLSFANYQRLPNHVTLFQILFIKKYKMNIFINR
ncbi:MAG: hypothetical protein K0R08_1514 [Solimicrobium sp.]|nr:hypothetical protein [Solimicrobium sp.]